jgi:hypothetical protein
VAQVVPQAPQLRMSVLRLTQPELAQKDWPVGQRHWPLEQPVPPLQILLQAPQLL